MVGPIHSLIDIFFYSLSYWKHSYLGGYSWTNRDVPHFNVNRRRQLCLKIISCACRGEEHLARRQNQKVGNQNLTFRKTNPTSLSATVRAPIMSTERQQWRKMVDCKFLMFTISDAHGHGRRWRSNPTPKAATNYPSWFTAKPTTSYELQVW